MSILDRLTFYTYFCNSISQRGKFMCKKVICKPMIQDGKVFVELPSELADRILRSQNERHLNYDVNFTIINKNEWDCYSILKVEPNLPNFLGMTDQEFNELGNEDGSVTIKL